MTKKQVNELYIFNFIIWFTVALLTSLGLFLNLIYYLLNK
jgi:hypothetical protein